MQDKRDATKTDMLAYITSRSEGARQTKQKREENESFFAVSEGTTAVLIQYFLRLSGIFTIQCINHYFLRLSGIFTIQCINNYFLRLSGIVTIQCIIN